MSAFTHKVGQVTYPRMERQDLTQAQLGSFKFTPTDEVRSVFASTSPRLAQQFTLINPTDARRNNQSTESFTAVPNIRSPVFGHLHPSNSSTQFGSSFFGAHNNSDLASSRLWLGPDALRAAIDSVTTSPPKTSINSQAFKQGVYADTTQFNMAQSNHTDDYSGSNYDVLQSLNPAASDFNMSDTNFLHTSLIRALATEQRAHQLTKDALQIEREEKLKLQSDAQRYLEHNRSLIGSVNMLKSVIQHSMKKEQEAVEHAESTCFQQEVEVANPRPTLLHDAVKNLKAPIQKPRPQPLAENRNLFNLDLVESQGSPALRKHFLIPEQNPEFSGKTSDDRDDLSAAAKSVRETLAIREKAKETWSNGGAKAIDSLQEVNEGDHLSALQSVPNNIPRPARQIKPKTMAMPFDPHVTWNSEPIFEDADDTYQRLGRQRTLFSQHPVRFLPEKSDKNLYRTVMIDFLPQGTTYKELLQNIRGGTVESIQLFGPIGKSASYMTARVVFNYELGARTVYMRGQDPGIKIQGKRVRVWQVLEATYPRNEEMQMAIFDEGYTRYLLIENAVKSSLDKLPEKLAQQQKLGAIIEIGKASDGVPMIEFTSVSECTKALDQLMNDRDFGGARFDFEEDPCNVPYRLH